MKKGDMHKDKKIKKYFNKAINMRKLEVLIKYFKFTKNSYKISCIIIT